jgi:hypothetical protein
VHIASRHGLITDISISSTSGPPDLRATLEGLLLGDRYGTLDRTLAALSSQSPHIRTIVQWLHAEM